MCLPSCQIGSDKATFVVLNLGERKKACGFLVEFLLLILKMLFVDELFR